MDEQRPAGTRAIAATSTEELDTAVRGICDECGEMAVLIPQIDPESPLSGSAQLCPTCARSLEPFWHDDR